MDISTNRIGCVVLEGGTDEIIEKKIEIYCTGISRSDRTGGDADH